VTNSQQTRAENLVEEWAAMADRERGKRMSSFFPKLPDYIQQINSCEAAYVLHPSALPFPNVPFRLLSHALKKYYTLSFSVGDSEKLKLLKVPLPNDAEELGELLVSLPKPHLEFENGFLRLPGDLAIKISRLVLTHELIFVEVVGGPTEAAEQVICEIVPLMWALVGVKKQWRDVMQLQQVATYGTGTRVRFPSKALGLLSGSLVELLNRWTALPDGVATAMGRRDRLHEFRVPHGSTVVFSLDELHILFQRNEPTGNHEVARLRIGVDARHERGTGVMSVESELPLKDHIELVRELVEAMS